MVTWVLEYEVFADADTALAVAVREAGAELLAWDDNWWIDGRWPRHISGPVVFHGSLVNADRIARELPWVPGAFCATPRFACTEWWPTATGRRLTDAYMFTTVTALVSQGAPPEFGERVFVRPDSPLKPFSGRVLNRDTITLAALDHGFYYDDEQLAVVVTPVVDIGTEWRFVVAAGVVVTGTEYVAAGRVPGHVVSPDHPAWRYAHEVVEEISPPDLVFVLDICETPDGLRLLELNPFSGADLYGCDRRAVVQAVHALIG